MAALTKLTDRFTETSGEGEIVVMRVDVGDFLSLSGTAAAAWSLINGTRDRDSLVAALAAQFSMEEREIAPDVDEFLEQLRHSGLIADG